jgi:nitrite reductase (NADH) large subunit
MHIVVIGNGMVGYKFCEKLTAKPSASSFQLTVFGEEPRPAYDRVHLSAYFSGTSVDELSMAPVDWYLDQQIRLHTGELVTHIDRQAKTIQTQHGQTIPYDKLILSTGSSAFVPPIPGVEKDGVFVYRTIEDLDAIMGYAKKARKAAVIGGGLLGLEAAKAMIDLGLETHVVEFASRLMPRQLDEAGAGILKAKLEALGISIHLNKNTACIAGEDGVSHMVFTDQTELDVDMVVISAGIKPRDELARKAGLEVGARGGIVVNDRLQTSDPDIYAIGEAALHGGIIYGLVAPGYEMADVVATNLTGGDKSFSAFDMSTKLKLIGVDVASFGDPCCTSQPHRTIVFEDKVAGIYKRINVCEEGKRLLGGVLVGEAESYNMLLQTAKNNIVLPPNPEDLILGARGGSGAAAASGVMSLPDDALICSCEGVTKGNICSAIAEQKLGDVPAIKSCTKAGTGCGGCIPMLGDLLTETLKAQGKVVKKMLCEHFGYSRQEIYDIIKTSGIRSYDDLLDQYGKGDGCEVCKPAVASLMASIWNELILKQATIQDTNDRFLANIQKGGTYSVIPRIPGGEITATKLMVIAQVADKYGLYCKITGGQRIDLLGARIDQLPDIWEELIEAGFESGHAYGKALRTVKSCVGSTWCRFGLHDSVSFAVEIEERYRGLRAPHKLKSAVSGCVRECAEAQSKDFGIIATDKGWNLYVCGNGGAKPQHAHLLASDIDSQTCIRYIDRFLMFYIKTAEPLNRTSTWLNKMEGGIAYLKDVVVNDSLGIGAQLEKEMQLMVDTYECEWKEIVNNPALRERFRHFVNVDEPDPSLQFVPERGQKVPVGWK